VDSDGDKIAVSSQIEFEELISQLSDETVLKVYVESEEEKKCINDEEEKEDVVEEKCHEEEKRNFIHDIENVFRGIPQMTENFVEDQKNNWRKTNQMFWGLHSVALTYLDSFDKNVVQKGKDLLLKMLEMVPNHMVTLYNLACAESLLGNVKEAIHTLDKAVNAGYRDLTHMINDHDFENIKNTEGFKQIVEKLKRIINPVESEEVPQEPKNVELKKESTLEDKVNLLSEIFPQLPKEILQEILTNCQESIEKVVDLINSSTF